MATDVTKNGEFEFNDAVIVRTFVLQESLSHQRLTEEKINCLYHVFVGVNCFYVSHCVRHIPDLPSPVGLLVGKKGENGGIINHFLTCLLNL